MPMKYKDAYYHLLNGYQCDAVLCQNPVRIWLVGHDHAKRSNSRNQEYYTVQERQEIKRTLLYLF